MNIFWDSQKSSSTSLAVYIDNLDYEEMEYDSFSIKVDDKEWVNVANRGTSEKKSDIYIFKNLTTYQPYTFFGQAIYKGQTIDVQKATINVQPIAGVDFEYPIMNNAGEITGGSFNYDQNSGTSNEGAIVDVNNIGIIVDGKKVG